MYTCVGVGGCRFVYGWVWVGVGRWGCVYVGVGVYMCGWVGGGVYMWVFRRGGQEGGFLL